MHDSHRRSVLLQDVEIDMVGFTEALRVGGDARVCLLLQRCSVSSSGGDAVAASGKARLTLQACSITGKGCGVKLWGNAAATLVRCTLQGCGAQAVRAVESARIELHSCTLQDNEGEGVVLAGDASAALQRCSFAGNKGPAVDVSEGTKACLRACSAEGNGGGLWLWDRASATLSDGCTISGGSSWALLVDGDATVDIQKGCSIDPEAVYVSSAATAERLFAVLQAHARDAGSSSSDSLKPFQQKQCGASAAIAFPAESGVFAIPSHSRF